MIVNWATKVNEKKYRENFDAIDWGHTPNTTPLAEAGQSDVRQSLHRMYNELVTKQQTTKAKVKNK
jgi:hypothetical protein